MAEHGVFLEWNGKMVEDEKMEQVNEVQHVYLVGAKSLGAYGGYETFVYKLTEYHQNKRNIKYHVACKANGDGCMDENKYEGVTRINDHEFELHNAHCFKINVLHRRYIMMLLHCGLVVNISKRIIFLIRLYI